MLQQQTQQIQGTIYHEEGVIEIDLIFFDVYGRVMLFGSIRFVIGSMDRQRRDQEIMYLGYSSMFNIKFTDSQKI